jgi:hypothetical protein
MTTQATMSVDEQMQVLHKGHWLRVDGLQVLGRDYRLQAAKDVPVSEARLRWDENNGVMAIRLTNGQTWIRSVAPGFAGRGYDIPNLGGPIERGLAVPCSNGEQLVFSEVLRRMASPLWEPQV